MNKYKNTQRALLWKNLHALSQRPGLAHGPGQLLQEVEHRILVVDLCGRAAVTVNFRQL